MIATSPAVAVDLDGDAPKPAAAKDDAPAKSTTFSATATQEGTDLVVKVTAATPADLNTVLVFFDTDGDASTGFDPPADPRFGFEAMIQGGSLSRHAGATRDAWAWTTIAPVKQTIDGNTAELRFNASLLKSTKLKMAVWQMSPDWQNRTDAWPQSSDGKASTADVAIDPSKLHTAISPADMPLAPMHANAALPARQRFADAKSYACYYGAGSLGPLSHVDAAILHVPAMTPADVKTLNNLGIVTIGYVSVGEDETLRTANGQGYDGKASWYFDKDHDGKPDENGTWGSYYANAADPAWRADRVAEAKRLCGPDYGFDGIFLDTIDTVDVYPASRSGMIQLIQELRAALPDKVIIDNRGFGVLDDPAVDRSIDGVMFEDFSTTYDFAAKQYLVLTPSDLDATRDVMVSTIEPATKINPMKVLALDYCEPDQTDRIQMAFDRAVTFGMLPAVASISLDQIYDTSKVVGHIDKKYLDVQATPESMQFKLPEPRNGFAAGTIIEPSSCFLSYTVATIVDGLTDHAGVPWNKSAWASAEEQGAPQQLLFKFPESIVGGTLQITFAYDNKAWYPSRDFSIDVSADGSAWKTVAHPTSQTANEYQCPLPTEPFCQLRIVQSPGGGSVARPNLMWVQQVKRIP